MSVSFANAEAISVKTPDFISASGDAPFDPKLQFNRVIQPAGGKNKFPTRSIDSGSILKKLSSDKIEDLRKITLACSYTRSDLMMWDAIVNLTHIAGITSCIFLADSDYNPIESSRTVSSSQFLNFELPGARLRLNKVRVGDKVGIGIYSSIRRTSYVLMYDVVGTCVAQDPEHKNEERPSLIHGVNVELIKAYRFNVNGEGDCLTLRKDDDTDVAHTLQTFVSYLVGTVMDITNAYPWKAHFVPVQVSAWDRQEIEGRVKAQYASVEKTSYDEFEAACNNMYNDLREDKIRSTPKKDRRFVGKGKKPEAPVEKPKSPAVPMVEVITLNDTAEVLVKLHNPNDESTKFFRFDKISMVDSIITESFLANSDLEGENLVENTNVLSLDNSVFGEEALVRYFSVNF